MKKDSSKKNEHSYNNFNFNSFRKKAVFKPKGISNNYYLPDNQNMKHENRKEIKKYGKDSSQENNFENELPEKIRENFDYCFNYFSTGGIYDETISNLVLKESDLVLIQKINRILKKSIIDLSIKDKDNFATASSDKKIQIWSKENKSFILYEVIQVPDFIPIYKDLLFGFGEQKQIINYLKNCKLIVACVNSIKIYTPIKSTGKHQLSSIIKYSYSVFNVRKDLLIFFDSNDCCHNISFYKLKKCKLIDKIKYFDDIPEQFDFLDDNRMIAIKENNIIIIFLKEKEIKKIHFKESWLIGLLVNENKKMFLVCNLKTIYFFNSDNYQIVNSVLISSSLSINKLFLINKEEMGILVNIDESPFYWK